MASKPLLEVVDVEAMGDDGERSSPDWIRARHLYQGLRTSRGRRSLMNSPLKITFAPADGHGGGECRSMAIFPPWFILSIMSWKALGTRTSPAHVEALCHAELGHHIGRASPLATLTARVAPILRASSSRYSLTSVIFHVAWRTHVAADGGGHDADGAGAGDEHVFPTRSKGGRCVPRCRTDRRWRPAHPGCCPAVEGVEGRGSPGYSANEPGRLTPTPMVLRHRWVRPARQLRQWPQVIWPSPDTRSPRRNRAPPGRQPPPLPHILVTHHHGHRMVFWDHSSQL